MMRVKQRDPLKDLENRTSAKRYPTRVWVKIGPFCRGPIYIVEP